MADVRLNGLDFDEIKENLKTYLKGQTEFSDYNFDGSAMSTLLDVLSYNTHYNSYYLNMVFNELFIDTAQKRSSVVSRAKELGYTPYSCKAATALVNLEIIAPDSPPWVVIPRGTIFVGRDLENIEYQFVTTESRVVERVNNQYVAENLEIKEGSLYNFTYTVTEQNKNKPFEIPNADVDLGTLVVTVKDDAGSQISYTYNLAENIEDIKSSTQAYFVQENNYGNFEIYFGNGIIGNALLPGNIVNMSYLVTNKAAANGIAIFSLDAIGSYSVIVTPSSRAFGGTEKESIELVRFNSTKHYMSRNRAVTTKDYEALIMGNFPDVETVKVWGGEDNDPVRYGSVFVSVKPVTSYVYPQSYLETVIKSFLNKKKLVTTEIFFRQPEYIYITVNSIVTIDPLKTTGNLDDFKISLIDSIQNYFDNELEKFDKNFFFSKFTTYLDNISPAIKSNLTSVALQKRFNPVLGSTKFYKVEFRNPIKPGTVKSSLFKDNTQTTTCRIKDVPKTSDSGDVHLYNQSGALMVSNVGTVDYSTGTINLQIRIDDTFMNPDTVYVDATPFYQDIQTELFNIITYNNASLNNVIDIGSGINITIR